jgi:hypothetical protein
MTNPQSHGLRQAVATAIEWARGGPVAKKQEFVRTPPPDASWISTRLAAVWLSGKLPARTSIDGSDGRLETAAEILFSLAREGKIEMLTLDEGRTHYFKRAAMEQIMMAGAIKLELSTDPSGAFVNRGADGEFAKAKEPIVVERGKQTRTEIASAPIPMPSPFGPRDKVPEASSGPYDDGWQG